MSTNGEMWLRWLAMQSDSLRLNLNDEPPSWEILGLAIPVDTPGKQLRIGEQKTMLALAV